MDWFWKTPRSRATGNAVELRVALAGSRELGKWLARRARELMDRGGFVDRSLSLSLVGDAEMQAINRQWRGKDKPTDVITFEGVDDVVISKDTAARQAREGGWPLRKELSRLLAHGLAHAVGHTHERRREALRMAAFEERLLGEAGMVGDSFSARRPPKKRVSSRTEKR